MSGTIGTRPDDEPEKFATRWDEFMNRTYTVIENYRTLDMVNEVNGMMSIEEVHASVMEIINRFDPTN